MEHRPVPPFLLLACVWLWFFGLLASVPATAQEFAFDHFTEKDGLPSAEVYGIEQDASGRLWMVTDRGLCWYDGYTFRPVNSSGLLQPATFIAPFNLKDRGIWLASLNANIYRISEDGEIFHQFTIKNDSVQPFRPSILIGLAIDSMGIMRSLLEGSPAHYIQMDTGQSVVQVKRLQEGDFPRIPVADLDTHLTLLRLPNNQRWLIHNYPRNNPLERYYFSESSLGEVAYILRNRFQTNTRIGLIREGRHTVLAELPTDATRNYFDRKGQLWVATKDGLYRFRNPGDGQPPDHFFEGYCVIYVSADRDNNYWICTQRNGVFRVSNFDLVDRHMKLPAAREAIASVAVVDSVLVYQNSFRNLEFHYPSGRHISYPSQGSAAAWTNSLVRVDGATSQLVIFNDHERVPTPQTFYDFPEFRLSNSNLYLDSAIKLAWEYQDMRLGPIEMHDRRIPHLNLEDRVMTLARDSAGAVWLGGISGFYRIQGPDYSQVTKISDTHPLLRIRISQIGFRSKSDDGLWISTMGNGLVYYHNDQAVQISRKNGLSSDFLQCFWVENDSVVWVGSTHGLDRVQVHFSKGKPRLVKVDPFGREEGLPTSRINSMTWWQNRLLLATDVGLLPVDLHALQPNTVAPLVMLESVRADSQQLSLTKPVELAADQRDIVFRFLGICQHKPANAPFYRFRLDKKDQSESAWSYTDDRSVQFTNLDYGDYTFVLQARNKNGNWSESPVVYPFSVLPHYSETAWFLALIILGSAGFLGAIIYIPLYLKRKDLVFRLRMQDSEIRLLRTQMNPHFLFNTLNGIQQLIFERNPEKASFYISKFSRLLRNNMDFSKQPYISVKAELEYLESYLIMEQSRFEEQFNVLIEVDPVVREEGANYFVPPFMVQPLVENAIQHGLSGLDYRGLLQLKVLRKPEGMLFVVEDNGLGFRQSKSVKDTELNHALDILKDRIKLLNIEWPAQKATLCMTNLADTDPNLTGVRISLQLPIISTAHMNQRQPPPG